MGKTSYKFGIPALLLFLAVGMLAGSDGLAGIQFDNPKLAQLVGVIALNFILFSGGLDTNWSSIRPVLKEGIALSTIGVLITALTLGAFVWLITDFTIYESLLLGSIVSSTDAAAVFSLLRSKSLALRTNLRPTLELESGSNDPMAYVLTVAFLSLVVNQDQSFYSVIPLFLQQMILGGVAGAGFGLISKYIINSINLDFEGLYPVLVIALMFITFSVTDYVGGNGFLAIYICAVYLGNQDLIHKRTIMQVFDGMAWLMEIILFLTLGLLVFPTEIYPIIGLGLLIAVFLIGLARPIAVFLSLAPFKMKLRRRVYISWVGIRGAVPIVFATYPLLAGIDKADMIFNIVFFVSLTSVLVHGTTLSIVAKWLGVAIPEKAKIMHPTDAFLEDHPKTLLEEMVVGDTDQVIGRKIVDIGFPKNITITMIKRDGKYLTPKGITVIEKDDILTVLSDSKQGIEAVYKLKNKNDLNSKPIEGPNK